MRKEKVLIAVLVILMLAGVSFCVFYSVFVFQKYQKESKALQKTAAVARALESVEVRTLSFVADVFKETQGHISPAYRLEDFTAIKQKFLESGVDFVEVNLPAMKVSVFKNQELKKEFPILLRGDPSSWGGTAAGLYKIEAGNVASFSVGAEVYMPYALKFYGKYYLHGKPYYPGGEKMVSDVSGGCLQLSDENAKELYNITEMAMPVLVIDKFNDNYEYPKQASQPFPNVSAESYLVADLGSGFVFAEKNSRDKLPIASLTKLMTALVVAENIDLTRSITVKESMLTAYGTLDHLETGKDLRVVELFYPLLVESSNNTAEVLTYFLGREKTIALMNEKARSILMPKTTFADPSGYDSGNISTVQDLFYLARYILNNRPPLFEITRSKPVTSFGGIGFNLDELWNKNVFSADETFVGGKTGFIKESKYNGLFVFRFKTEDNEERDVAIILLASPHQDTLKSDTQKIYLWLIKNYFPNTPYESPATSPASF